MQDLLQGSTCCVFHLLSFLFYINYSLIILFYYSFFYKLIISFMLAQNNFTEIINQKIKKIKEETPRKEEIKTKK